MTVQEGKYKKLIIEMIIRYREGLVSLSTIIKLAKTISENKSLNISHEFSQSLSKIVLLPYKNDKNNSDESIDNTFNDIIINLTNSKV